MAYAENKGRLIRCSTLTFEQLSQHASDVAGTMSIGSVIGRTLTDISTLNRNCVGDLRTAAEHSYTS